MHGFPERHCTVTALTLYPLKSGAPVTVRTARVLPEGFAGDRRVMAVDAHGMCLTARTCPGLMRVHCALEGGLIILQ
ncbi:MAG TPA: MOSC N-terminal beta barrel domain-containing protein [Woeseiaceae bacterium]